ncbi:MAG: sigma-70 family RNA polymerase sigma factor [Proteiniphilum sp.]|jgi:RNA polymerase sigma-70 factor (ECF subfamily)|nr:sigma-70 family RNA polymerase sigma factor [Candidatus Cloacimonadota bacterium]MDD3978925.1 sigma-70 family RNA polymerase sigma factor [Proteiniphilum sp.]NCD15297.1 sigma-70 family RNA polymerase sigma factor [Bacteroidia bacterium]HHT33889.1 sigma-70 family RNA polymerase sigma factor [Bacteroidales bacterium]MDD5619346.1 sigma-70 family RNA polymerase sigma factor [Proteiniphilum sp.]
MKVDSFHTLILPLREKLFRHAFSIVRNRAEAEDILQDLLLKLWSRREEWNEIENPEAYCYRAIRNMSLDRLAVAANRRTGIVNPEEQGRSFIDHESPHSRMVRKEQHALIAQCIAQLPERQQTVFRLREVDEMSYQQIAATLEISEDLVKVSLFRARKKMQELLIEQEMIDGHPLHTEAEKGNGTITGHQ